MRYVIIGRHEAKGVIGSDSGDLDVYYELGWELAFSNIIAKRFLSEGILSSSDIIVTKEERKFFYSKVFDNVIDWESFKKITRNPNDEVHYLTRTLDPNSEVRFGDPHPERLSPEITCNFDLIEDIEEKYEINSPFGIYCIRLRDWCDWRNSDLDVARSAINKFTNELGIKMFMVGQNSEELAKELNINYVDLREYGSLTNSKHCKFCISPLSGIIHLTNFCGHDNLHNFIFDHNNERQVENNAVLMGNNINYKKVKNVFLKEKETEQRIFDLFETYIKPQI